MSAACLHLLLTAHLHAVFWVFGSSSVVGENVMMKMATSDVLSGPVRLLFPHAIAPGTHPSFPFSLLGTASVLPAFLRAPRSYPQTAVRCCFSSTSSSCLCSALSADQ